MSSARPVHVSLPGPHAGLRIGVFGGSFNPAHAGHAHVATTAMKALQLDFVWWAVAAGNPLKAEHGDYYARLASARAFTARHPRMIVTDIERQLGVCYSVDLIAALRLRSRRARFVWIMGGDSLVGFHRWKSWQNIARALPIAIVARPGAIPAAGLSRFARQFAGKRLPANAAPALPFQPAPAWVYLPAPLHRDSSTTLRATPP